MGADEVLSARQIRQPVTSLEGIQASFDNGITWQTATVATNGGGPAYANTDESNVLPDLVLRYNFKAGAADLTVAALARSKGYEVIERHILPEELSSFSECFLTGTAAEVTPVSQIGEYSFTPAAISLDLMDTYARLVRREA